MMLKNTLKKIKKSIGKYISIILIILIGVSFYAGIKLSVPDIKRTQNDYYQDTNLMDLKIISTHGLTKEDVKYLTKNIKINEVEGSYSKDVFDSDQNVIKINSITEKINKVKIIEGTFPQKNNECLADYRYYKIGDKIKIMESEGTNLQETEFNVVGIIMSPMYTSTDYGVTNIGNGKLKSYIYVLKDVFTFDTYTEVYLTINKNKSDYLYSSSYEEKVEQAQKHIEGIKHFREEVLETKLLSYKPSDSYNDIDVKWYIYSRSQIINSYQVLNEQYKEIEVIADVIPIFFILIVVLMTSNTMTRMITEERSEMGTFTSLGVSNIKIILNYLVYVLSSTIIGVIFGFIIGTLLLPQLVYTCIPITIPNIIYKFDFSIFATILLISCLTMTLVTIVSCMTELKQTPAYLLRPKSPKKGKNILLEKNQFLWNKLSFSWKITLRNISRYKKRVFMTLVGTAGCTFLILIGFAIKDSVNGVGDKQYTELFKYDNLIILNNEISQEKNILTNKLNGLIKDELYINQSSCKVVNEEKRTLDIYLVVPEETKLFYDYFILRDYLTKKQLKLNNEGVIITPRIKEIYEVEIGDKIYIEDLNKNKYELIVVGITENYVANYIYMNQNLYEKIFNKKLTYNAFVGRNVQNEDKIAKELLLMDEIINVNFSKDLLEKANNGIVGLNNIVLLLVVIASLLAFTVLYNLTSINISERTREIATLKVLGFKDIETNEYIYRETIITVVVGIIFGLIITPILHNYIIDLLEADNVILLREIKLHSYIYASVLTLCFALIMQLITYVKLKKIDMIESLKSVE